MSILYLIPNGDGDLSQCITAPTAGLLHYTMIDDPVGSPDDLTTYLTGDPTKPEGYVISLFTIPDINISNSVISNLQITIRGSGFYRDGSPKDYYFTFRLYIKTNNTIIICGSWFTNSIFSTYSVDLYTNPVTNLPWTINDINSLQIGCGNVSRGDKEPSTNVTQVYGILTYVPKKNMGAAWII